MTEISLANIPLEWIRAFETAGRLGSFTAAASELNVTQAAISQRITNLETRIGTRLFLRRARGISLSVDGEAWLPYVSSALRDLADSYEDLFGIQRDRLTISASASVTSLWLAQRLKGWHARNRPQIVFSTMILHSTGQHRDASIRVEYGTGNWPDHHMAPLYPEALSPVASPALCAGATPWQDLPRIAVSGPRPGWQDWTRKTGDPATPVPGIRFDSFAGALAAAIAGAGVLLASLPLAGQALQDGRLMRLCDETLTPQGTYWMVARREAITKTLWTAASAHFASAPMDQG